MVNAEIWEARELLADPADDAEAAPRDSAVEFLRDLLELGRPVPHCWSSQVWNDRCAPR